MKRKSITIMIDADGFEIDDSNVKTSNWWDDIERIKKKIKKNGKKN